jgi:hypothetical protein
VEGKNLQGSNVKGKNKQLAFVIWIFESDSLEEGAPLTTQERRAYLRHAYRPEFLYIVMQFYEMKEFKSESIDPKWLCRENQESTKHFSVKCNELLSCFTSRLFVLKDDNFIFSMYVCRLHNGGLLVTKCS